MQRALAQLQPSDRAIQAVWSGVPGAVQPHLPAARPHRARRDDADPRAEAVRRRSCSARRRGAARSSTSAPSTGSRAGSTLRSGRLPQPCTPSDCELIQIGGAPAAPKLPFLHVVGRATFRPGAPLARTSAAAASSGRRSCSPTASCRSSARRCPTRRSIARTYGWIVPVAPRSIHDWELASLGARLDRAQSTLEQASDIFTRRRADRHDRGDSRDEPRRRRAAADPRRRRSRAAARLRGARVDTPSPRPPRRAPAPHVVGRARVADPARRRDGGRSCITVVATARRLGSPAPARARCSRATLGSPGGSSSSTRSSPVGALGIGARARRADRRRHARRAARPTRSRSAGCASPSPTSLRSARSRPCCSRSRAARPTRRRCSERRHRRPAPAPARRSCCSCSPSPPRGCSRRCCARSSWSARRAPPPVAHRAPLARARAGRGRCSPSSSSCSASASRSSRSRTARRSCRASASRRATPCPRRIVLQEDLEQLVTVQQAAPPARCRGDAGRCATRAS